MPGIDRRGPDIRPLPPLGAERRIPKETLVERNARFAREGAAERKGLDKIARAYGDATKLTGKERTYAFADANDRLLRTILKRPYRDRDSLNAYFSRLREPISRVGSLELSNQFEKAVNKSIEQLVPFIERTTEREPHAILATSVSMDVDLGVDLVRSIPTWDPESGALSFNVSCYQAKSGAVDDAGARRLAEQYREKSHHAMDYFRRYPEVLAFPSEREHVLSLNENDMLRLLIEGREAFARLEQRAEESNPVMRYTTRVQVANQVNNFARKLGEPELDYPIMRTSEVDYRLLVRTRRGNEDIPIQSFFERSKLAEAK